MKNTQRAVWTLLLYSLVGPFLGALCVALALALAAPLGLAGLLPDNPPALGEGALETFVWSIVPATLAGLILAAVVLRAGTFSWMVSAIVGVIAFAVAAAWFPIGLENGRPFLAFLSGVFAVGVREVLIHAGVIAT